MEDKHIMQLVIKISKYLKMHPISIFNILILQMMSMKKNLSIRCEMKFIRD